VYKYNIAIRNTGNRINNLMDIMICLNAQTNQNFDITICTENDLLNDVNKMLNYFELEFQKKIKVVTEEKNRSKKLAKLIEEAESDYIVFLDDDDHITSNYIEAFDEIINVDLVISKSVDRDYDYPTSLTEIRECYDEISIGLFEFFDNYWPLGSVAFKLDKIREIRLKEEIQFLEDWAIIQEMLGNGCSFAYTSIPTFIYNKKTDLVKLTEFELSRQRNFDENVVRERIAKYFGHKSIDEISQEIAIFGRKYNEKYNRLGIEADNYRKNFEILNDLSTRMQNERLYLTLLRFRNVLNILRRIISK